MDVFTIISICSNFYVFTTWGFLNIYLRDPLLTIFRNNWMIEGILIGLNTALSFKIY